ncbi:MAG: YihA family ribosome biogenesis GTP-binding protein [Bacteroidales bacterium]|nr:YihA family ribosome biogenesis GTP-binding protein [Bacteroidales bacterium]
MKISQAIYAGSSTRVSRKPGRKLPEFAFIGRSNVGKSSLINMLCGKSRLALTSATPGKTKVVNHFLVNDKWYLVDLPGYGYAKMSNKGREELTAVISDYILNSQEMVMLFVLVDSRYEITARDLDFISNLGQNRIPFGIVFTKCDKMGPNALKAVIDKDCEILSSSWEQLPPMFTTSSRTAAGKEELLNYIDTILASL